MNYFHPDFILGLTATPKRMDNKDVFPLFELRLRDAIINDLVVLFHYYAIKDDFADYSSYDKSKIAREIAHDLIRFMKVKMGKMNRIFLKKW